MVNRFQEIAQRSDIAALKEEFSIEDTAYWSLAEAKRKIRRRTVPEKMCGYFYRPFDFRFVFYEPDIIERGDGRWNVMQHMLQQNVALICTRQTNPTDFTEILVSDKLVDKRSLASFTGEARAYPLYIYEETLTFDLGRTGSARAPSRKRSPNLSAAFLDTLAAQLRLSQSGARSMLDALTPEDILHYAYAVFHSPGYRSRYAEFLKIDFPRLPLTSSLDMFRALARLGGELVALYLMESPKLDRLITRFVGPADPEVRRVGYSVDAASSRVPQVQRQDAASTLGTVWIDAPPCKKGAKQQPGAIGFRGVPEPVWNFHVGGYQVCEKWLKDRKGRKLSKDDIAHYQKIVVALSETIRLMRQIDEVIDRHGGWPGAFSAGPHGKPGP